LNINRELSVIAIPNLVLFHGGNIKINLDKDISENLYEKIENEDFYAIALTLKEDDIDEVYKEDDFYRVGSLVKVRNRRETKEGHEYDIDIIERIEVREFILLENTLRVKYDFIPDIIDIGPKEQKEVLDHIRDTAM